MVHGPGKNMWVVNGFKCVYRNIYIYVCVCGLSAPAAGVYRIICVLKFFDVYRMPEFSACLVAFVHLGALKRHLNHPGLPRPTSGGAAPPAALELST